MTQPIGHLQLTMTVGLVMLQSLPIILAVLPRADGYLNPSGIDPLHPTGIKRKIEWKSSIKPVPTWKEGNLLRFVICH